ncbi:hypothetical protein C6P45_000031 [Maudiozyma exigua]|uniref:Anaphase-promoting complex subunit 4 WD40 domain-containing protein n=1 Tax=Maudiozyma exigua TaxID=34358 RepID=A0A9P7BE37_MAUEX|nr:hypothetical protein C6P45_000031 [Kazachstania exigua]
MAAQLKDLSHYGPSLCVKFIKSNCSKGDVFAAIGPFLHVYNYKTSELIHRVRIFTANKVHGFNVSRDGKYCVFYGSKSLTMCSIDDLFKFQDISSSERMFTEWIMDATFSANGDQVYILTCYNLVLITDLENNILERKNLLNERSILYSGTIKVLSNAKVIVNAGTVLGGILIWDLFNEEKIHNLTGHEGSIFYVTVSDNGKYVASCSDDRSIRLWDFETGEELSIGWGHTARIWNLKFFNNDTQLISVSEDCTCRLWDIVKNDSSVKLIMTNIYETHLIKNVWGVDVNEMDGVAVTSGNDGRIKKIDLKQTTRYGNELQSFNISKLPTADGLPLDIKSDEIFKGFHWFNFGLVAITSYGKVIKLLNTTMKWELVLSDDRFESYSMTNGISDYSSKESSDDVVVFSNNKCDLLMLKFSKDGKTLTGEQYLHVDSISKLCNCMVVKNDGTDFYIALESPNPRDKFVVLKINIATLEIVHRFNFNKPLNFVSSCLEVFGNRLLVGSRFSTIAIFNLLNEEEIPYMIRRINEGDTITSIKCFEQSENGNTLFSVTNRDGYYNFIKVDMTLLQSHPDVKEDNISIHTIIHSNKVIKGFLEGTLCDGTGDYITYDFKSSLFYIYNETNGYEIASQVCGGAHRQWKLTTLGDDSGYMLVYIKASELYLRRIYHNSNELNTLENGIHGREIRDLSILNQNTDHENQYLFVTGSEDTTVKLCKYDTTNGVVTNYWTQRQHVSGLQRVKFINDKLMISCSAREELFLWEINTEFTNKPYMTIRKPLPTLKKHPDLRIMDFDVLLDCNNTDNFISAAVYSDSTIKIWYYNYSRNEYESCIWENRYETCCILNTSFVQIRDRLYLLIAATDGYLTFYDLTSELSFIANDKQGRIQINEINSIESTSKPVFKIRVHKSGIKTLDVNVLDNGTEFQVFTGGDDNAIAMSIFRLKDVDITGEVTSLIENAASSTVTSCQLFENKNKLLTTSVDQRVRVWDITSDNKLVLKHTKYTTIADTGSCDIIKTDKNKQSIILGGVGLSVWEY